jgi:uncharacterized protein (DUF2236 family)
METVRETIAKQVWALTGAGDGGIDLSRPPGDDGLFGPKSVCWRVHGDFTSMMIGGSAALMLQMLHPLALAGVWDHSNFQRDMLGRLKRTAQFIAGTTYGATAEAERLIERVRTIHDYVHGTLPDGTPYDANDPALLTWVHVAEVRMFLSGYLRYRNPAMPAAEQDRYFAEYADVARRLGATDVPTSRREVDAYLRDVRPQLRFDERTRTVLQALLSQPAPNLAVRPFGELTLRAAIDLLPPWARTMLELRERPAEGPLVRAGARGVGMMLRWALNGRNAEGQARRG